MKDVRVATKLRRFRPLQYRRLKDALFATEEKYRAIFEESPNAIFYSSMHGDLIDINPAGVRLLGFACKEELLQFNLHEFLYRDEVERIKHDEMLIQNGLLDCYDVCLRTKDNKILYAQEFATAIRDANGNVIAYRAFLKDVTRVRQLEEQLLHANKLQITGRFASSVAHDFNNLLNVISAYCELIQRLTHESDPVRSFVNDIEQTVEMGISLTRQLLTFNRRPTAEAQDIDLNAVISDLRNLLQRVVGSEIQVHFIFSPAAALVRADRGQLEQMILNLAVNARDAMPEGGTLMLKTEVASGYAELNMSDTGTGMDENIQAHLFEPFFTTKTEGKGTGLGLYIVSEIVKQHSGTIQVFSKPDEGTAFRIRLPQRR